MKVIKGKYKGKEFQVGQYCNDWFSAKEKALIFSPTMIELSVAEMQDLFKHIRSTGIMFGLYELLPTGRFKKRKFNKLNHLSKQDKEEGRK